MSEPEIIYLLGRPHRLVSRKLIEAWHSDGKPLRYTAETVVRVKGEARPQGVVASE